MKSIIVGTAGHIDHGKTALVKALTGIDADRLKEEKQRGITIDIGFADLTIGDLRFGFVDVPGHERFVKNMLAGAHGLDLVMLVIAADESVMPQTREHFDICRLLHIKSGLVVITKIDTVDEELREIVQTEVAEFLTGSFLDGAPIVCVSSKTGEGINELRDQLITLATGVAAKTVDAIPRLPIDRTFTIKGFGTVVTGTLIAGRLTTGEEIEILPGGRRGRIRNIQVHNSTVPEARAGQRTAINLQGIELDAVERGQTLLQSSRLRETSMIDARVELLKSAPRPLRNRARVRFHHGTLEALARIVVLGKNEIAPGENALVQLRLESPTIALPSDRFILRSYSPSQTIAGGIIIDNLPAKHRINDRSSFEFLSKLEKTDDIERIALLVSASGDRAITHSDLAARTGLTDDAISLVASHLIRNKRIAQVSENPLILLSIENLNNLKDRVLETIKNYHKQEPLGLGIAREEIREKVFTKSPQEVFRLAIAELINTGKISAERDLLRIASHALALSADDQNVKDKLELSFKQAGLQPLALTDVISQLKLDSKHAQKLFSLLTTEGKLVKIADLIFHREAIDQLKNQIRQQKVQSSKLDVSRFKDMTGVSRKYAIPLLEFLDRERITRRIGNDREIL